MAIQLPVNKITYDFKMEIFINFLLLLKQNKLKHQLVKKKQQQL